jgi:hypothetical protein
MADLPLRNALAAEMSQSLKEKSITKCCETAAPKDRQRSAHGGIANRLTCAS